MLAWETERRVLEKGIPVILSEEQQTWDVMPKLEADEDTRVRLQWESHVPGSYALEKLIYGAVSSMELMGFDVSEVTPLLERGEAAFTDGNMSELSYCTHKIHSLLNALPTVKDHPYHSYTVYETFDRYAAAVKFPAAEKALERDVFRAKTYAGWVAQIIGGAQGTALEGYTTENIEAVFGDIDGFVRKPNTMNDDITFELAFLLAFEKSGYAVTSDEIALQWVAQVPFGWSAEDVALRNIRLGVRPPMSGYAYNPYREWIGAQMRGAVCGMAAPGDAKLAAELAWRDAVVSHHNNGVLGEVFNAILVSLAYYEDDMRALVNKCVSLMPEDSEYGAVVRFALDACVESNGWREAWQKCDERYIKYNWVHAYPNACAQIVALWFGQNDFDKTMRIICLEGMDVDCNAAQILTALGVSRGTSCIADKWTEPLDDMLDTYLRDIKRISIRSLSERTVTAAEKAIAGR